MAKSYGVKIKVPDPDIIILKPNHFAGKQIVSTAYGLQSDVIAPHMFTRRCQGNFFAYAMHIFPIEILEEHGTEPLSATEKVVNPIWRETERQRNSAWAKLNLRMNQ